MPRVRPKKKTKRLLDTLASTVGPAIDKAVAEEKRKEIEESKPITYCKMKLRNLLDRGIPASFTYNGLAFNIPENEEIEIRKEVADHLDSLMTKELAFVPDPLRPGKNKKVVKVMNRFLVQVLETYEKAG